MIFALLHLSSVSAAEHLGTAIETVVNDLDAPHLKPSGIEERLVGGLDASIFGLLTLVCKLADPPVPESGA